MCLLWQKHLFSFSIMEIGTLNLGPISSKKPSLSTSVVCTHIHIISVYHTMHAVAIFLTKALHTMSSKVAGTFQTWLCREEVCWIQPRLYELSHMRSGFTSLAGTGTTDQLKMIMLTIVQCKPYVREFMLHYVTIPSPSPTKMRWVY